MRVSTCEVWEVTHIVIPFLWLCLQSGHCPAVGFIVLFVLLAQAPTTPPPTPDISSNRLGQKYLRKSFLTRSVWLVNLKAWNLKASIRFYWRGGPRGRWRRKPGVSGGVRCCCGDLSLVFLAGLAGWQVVKWHQVIRRIISSYSSGYNKPVKIISVIVPPDQTGSNTASIIISSATNN